MSFMQTAWTHSTSIHTGSNLRDDGLLIVSGFAPSRNAVKAKRG